MRLSEGSSADGALVRAVCCRHRFLAGGEKPGDGPTPCRRKDTVAQHGEWTPACASLMAAKADPD